MKPPSPPCPFYSPSHRTYVNDSLDTQRHAKKLSAMLGASMLLIGVCGLSYEYSFSRLATSILGDSTKQWALVIGVMMFFMGIGADAQKYFSQEKLLERFIFLEIMLGLVGGFGPSLSLYIFGAWHDLFVVVHYLLIAAVGFLIGIEIPLLVRINQVALPSLRENLGLILKMDYIGSFIGAVVWVFVLPHFLDLLEIPYLLGLINASVGLATLVVFRHHIQKPKGLYALGGLACLFLASGLTFGTPIRLHLEQRLFKDPVIYSETSQYQHIVFTENKQGRTDLYINGHLQFSSADEHIYHEFLVHPVMGALPEAKHILVMGGGDGLAVRELLKYPQITDVTLVDLDPKMVHLAKTFGPLVKLNQGSLNQPKVAVKAPLGTAAGDTYRLNETGQGFFRQHKKPAQVQLHALHLDAFQFAQSAPGRYDAIILDFPDPNDPDLSKLYSLEFYQQLKQLLVPGGLMIQQSTSPAAAISAFEIIGKTMQTAGFSVLALHHPVPSFGDWGFWVAGHAENYGNLGLKQKLSELQLPSNVRYLTQPLVNGAQAFGKGQLNLEKTAVNRLLQDNLFQAYQGAWERLQ